MKILVVEDSEIITKLMSISLAALGFITDVASTGNEAIKLSCENKYDLIFMDIGLPDIDGINVTKQIRKNNTYYENIPIIALTAHNKEETREACLVAGMNDFMTKPIDIKHLYELIYNLKNKAYCHDEKIHLNS